MIFAVSLENDLLFYIFHNNLFLAIDYLDSIYDNDYDLLFDSYIKNNSYILDKTDKYRINYNNLFNYIRLLAINEEERYKLSRDYRDSLVPMKKIEPIEEFDKNKIEYYFLINLAESGYILKKKYPEYRLSYTENNNILRVNRENYDIIDLFSYGFKHYNNKKMVINYLESFQYILDLYFNGIENNKFWYYRFKMAPSLTDIINFSKDIKINIEINNTKFFNKDQYDQYRKIQLDRFFNKVIPGDKIDYFEIYKIYNCLNVAFLDKCNYKVEYNFDDPIQFIKKFE